MKSNIKENLQRYGLRLPLCFIAMTLSTAAFAQDEDTEGFAEEEVTTVKQPRRVVVVDDVPTCEVKGMVVDEATKSPLAGVRIQTTGDARYTAMTDAKGEFTIKVPTFAKSLYVQSPRYMSQQVAIDATDGKTVNISMLSNAFREMYNEGTTYTSQNSFVSNGSRLSIDDEISTMLGADIRSIMRSGNEEQGAMMLIRGINSINANSQPLIILDGVELDMQRNRSSLHIGDYFNVLSTISPEDIDKVTVLKNATALYGARGANGVIIIDTKRGHSMATRIDAKIFAGITTKPSLPTMMNASQYRNYVGEQLGTVPAVQEYQAMNGAALNFRFFNDDPTGYFYQMYHNDTDWTKEVLRTAVTQNYSINVQGGDDIGMYHLSVGYTSMDKSIKETSFDRVNVRFNTDISLLENLTTKFDMSFSRTNTYLFDDGFASDLSLSTVTSPIQLALIKSPLLNPYQYNHNVNGFTSLLSDADDLFSALHEYKYSLSNPVALIEYGQGERKNKNENTFFNVAVAPTWQILPSLSATTHFSYYLNRNSQAYYRPNQGVPAFDVANLGRVYSKVASLFGKETNIISNTHIDWNKKYGANDLAITGGFRYTYFSYDNSYLSSQFSTRIDNDKNPHLDVNAYSDIQGVSDVWKNMQWYASADYSYNNRFYATLSLLLEANSRFGKNVSSTASIGLAGVRWAIFPSIQMGWVVSNEAWYPKNAFVNYFKLFGGFDVSGNDDISNYAARSSFAPVRYNNKEMGVQMNNVGNDLVKWETTLKYNVGFKANMANNRLSLGLDAYYHRTKDLLSLKSFDNPVGGINNYWVNDGMLDNVGLELAISGKPIEKRNLHLELGATMGTYRNRVCRLADGAFTSSVYGDSNILTQSGSSVGVFYGYQTADHVFSTEAEAATAHNGTDYLKFKDATGADQTFNAGDVHFIDQNGDGYIDEQDKVIIGNPNPDIYGNIFATLTWKRFTFNVGFNYCVGNDVYNYQRSILNSGASLYNQQVAEIAHWRYEGQVTNMPRLAFEDPKGNNRFSDRWIEDGSFLRMKTLSVAYQIPMPESWQSWLQGISVWGEARNLFTVTKYTGNDPEFSVGNSVLYQGIDCGSIAQSRSFILGVKINL